MRTRDDVIREVLVRNRLTTTDGFVTDTILRNWWNDSNKWAAAAKPWPFTEGRVSTTYATTEEWNFEGYKADSFRFIQIGGSRLQKINFEDYQIFREEQSADNDRVYSDYGGLVYINPNTGLSGTLTAYGQYTPVFDLTDENGLSIFSNYNEEANEVLVEKMTAYLKRRQDDLNGAEVYDGRANAKLNEVWDGINKEQFAYHTKDRGMFERIDVLNGGLYDDLVNTDQF